MAKHFPKEMSIIKAWMYSDGWQSADVEGVVYYLS